MTEPWERQETQSNAVVPEAPDYKPKATAWIPVAIVFVLVCIALFGLGYWVAPNAPSQLDQVKSCAGLNDDKPGYNVKVTDLSGKVVLDVPCTSAAVTPAAPAIK